MSLTKIVATIGPASDSEEIIKALITEGVDVFRFNFKHSDLDWHKERILRVQKISKEMNNTLGILLDLQGPEIRLRMPVEEIQIEKGEKILLSDEVMESKEKGFSLSDPSIIDSLPDGQSVLADDGQFVFTLRKEGKAYLESASSGILKNKKAINIPGFDFKFPVIHERDREGLRLAKETGVDFIALSFVRDASDLKELKKEMESVGLDAQIVSKIETKKAIDNIDEIINETNVVMIARGDLGVELPAEEVPYYQKTIIKKCIEKGIPVITATQMLETMTSRKTPTRAEVSDVANAVYDFTDAVMLSGETASGEYPTEAVKVMEKISTFTEDKNRLDDIRSFLHYELETRSQMVCDSAFNLYKALKAKNEKVKGFVVFTHSGKTAKTLSRYRPHTPIFAFCPNLPSVKGLSISYGVTSLLQENLEEKDEIVKDDIEESLKLLTQIEKLEKGDLFIILHGDYWNTSEGVSTIRVVEY